MRSLVCPVALPWPSASHSLSSSSLSSVQFARRVACHHHIASSLSDHVATNLFAPSPILSVQLISPNTNSHTENGWKFQLRCSVRHSHLSSILILFANQRGPYTEWMSMRTGQEVVNYPIKRERTKETPRDPPPHRHHRRISPKTFLSSLAIAFCELIIIIVPPSMNNSAIKSQLQFYIIHHRRCFGFLSSSNGSEFWINNGNPLLLPLILHLLLVSSAKIRSMNHIIMTLPSIIVINIICSRRSLSFFSEPT